MYDWNPEKIAIDYSRAEKNAIIFISKYSNNTILLSSHG